MTNAFDRLSPIAYNHLITPGWSNHPSERKRPGGRGSAGALLDGRPIVAQRRPNDRHTDCVSNPEDAMPARNELIDDMIAQTPDWRGATLARLREIIHAADPDIVEAVKWRRPANPIGTAVFEHAGIVCFGVILKERVRLGFWAGARLPDPQGLYNAQLKGNQSRAIDFYEGDDLKAGALTALIRTAVEHNRAQDLLRRA